MRLQKDYFNHGSWSYYTLSMGNIMNFEKRHLTLRPDDITDAEKETEELYIAAKRTYDKFITAKSSNDHAIWRKEAGDLHIKFNETLSWQHIYRFHRISWNEPDIASKISLKTIHTAQMLAQLSAHIFMCAQEDS